MCIYIYVEILRIISKSYVGKNMLIIQIMFEGD